ELEVVVERGLDEPTTDGDPCVEDQRVDVPVAHCLDEVLHAVIGGQVRLDSLDGELRDVELHLGHGRVLGAEQQVVALLGEHVGNLPPDPARGAGDDGEGAGTGGRHGFLPGRWASRYADRPQPARAGCLPTDLSTPCARTRHHRVTRPPAQPPGYPRVPGPPRRAPARAGPAPRRFDPWAGGTCSSSRAASATWTATRSSSPRTGTSSSSPPGTGGSGCGRTPGAAWSRRTGGSAASAAAGPPSWCSPPGSSSSSAAAVRSAASSPR